MTTVRNRLLILAVHPETVAATRLRAAQYEPWLRQHGVDTTLWSFFRERDLKWWFGPSHVKRAMVAIRALLRVPAATRLARRADVVLVQREALPFGPPLLEWWAARRCRLVWDVDDAVWVTYVSPTAGKVPRWLRATGDKFRMLCRTADEVWAGSEILATWCRVHNPDVAVVPTVVDVPRSPPTPSTARTIGWVGSHSTTPFLEAVLPALAEVRDLERLLIVGARPTIPPGVTAEVRPWSASAEEQALGSIRVGLYPIDVDHPLAEGKCGLKAVLYMSRGIPPVVTPTTINATIVRHGVEGLHARTLEEWTAACERLLRDDGLWQRLSRAAWERARAEYSTAVWGPAVASRLVALLAKVEQ